VNSNLLIVSQALIKHQDGVSLHPDLLLWEKELATYKQTWFESADKIPLAWYAALCDISPTVFVMKKYIDSGSELPSGTTQCWLVSPYYAQLLQTKVRVYPEGLFAWSAADADALCKELNPLLAEEGMSMIAVGAVLLLCCRDTMDVAPLGFGAISGQFLPDSHHLGKDGGRLNRLLSEIQMLLFQTPLSAREASGDVPVSGIWLSSGMEYPVDSLKNSTDLLKTAAINIATRNPALQSLVDGNNATVVISEVERLSELLKKGVPLPKRIVLAGEGLAVLLKHSLLPRFGKAKWQAKSIKAETALLTALRGVL